MTAAGHSHRPYRAERKNTPPPALRKQDEPVERWMDVEGLASLLDVNPAFVYQQISRGVWPYHAVGRRYRFSAADVRLIEELTAVAPRERWRKTGT